MKPFNLCTNIAEYARFADFAKEFHLGVSDLILTNEYIYHPMISALNLNCQTLFQEKYGVGEPTDIMIDGILDELKDKQYHRIIAVGGGTIIDIAKVIAVAAPTDKTDDLYKNKEHLTKLHPLIVVPTTCGTGSEVTNISVINRTTKETKMGLAADALYADTAALIADMLDSLPYGVFATSSIDAMIHAVESYLSPNACNISKMFSEAALKLIVTSWKKAVTDNIQNSWKAYKSDFLRASNWAGIAFGYAGCAAVHALSYPLGATHHISHGQSNQLMFQSVMEKYKELQPVGKINELEALLADYLECEPQTALSNLYILMNQVLPKKPLREHGVIEKELPVYSKSVINEQQRLLKNNYVPLSEAEILDIYKNAY